jgi:tetratricopeptide (TPR) repeat protein
MTTVAADLDAGILAIRAGKHENARAALLRVLEAEPHNELAWLWLSRAMPTLEQSLRCIEHLLSFSPRNAQALEALDVLKVRLLLEESAVLRAAPSTPSTPQRRYLLGEALVEARIITPHQLQTALNEQAKLAARKRPLRLGEVLLRLKLVQPEQLAAAVAAQMDNAASTANADSLGQLGAFLIRQGLLTRAQLHQGLVRQAAMQRQGKPILLGEVLVRCGYIERDQLSQALGVWQQQYEDQFI